VFALREQGRKRVIQIFCNDYLYNTVHQITQFGAGTSWVPIWSPTEDTIAFVSNESHNDEIWVMHKDQWPASQLTHNQWEWDHHPSWSPDGKQLVFSSNRVTGKNQLWLMNANGGNQHQLTGLPFEAWDPVWVKYLDQ
jgi:TolB protein